MRLIDADFVKQKMNQTMDYQDLYLPIHFEQVLDDSPTVSHDEVRGVGEWIDYQQDRWVYAKCSECGTVHDVRSTYCPSCGARMKGAEDGTTE